MPTRKVILYICMSLDGFIATKEDDISWLSIVDVEGEDYGYFEFVKDVDTYMVGRKSYDKVLSMIGHFPQAKKFDCYVLTRQEIENKEGITFYNGDIETLIKEIRQSAGGNIYCDGGGEIVKLFLDLDLIDEFRISIIPHILGEGKRLFIGQSASRDIKLVSTKKYPSGLVHLVYHRKRETA